MPENYPPALKKFVGLFSGDLHISDLTIHDESTTYSACRFRINNKIVEFRLAKITPKKVGQFVSIWKRDHIGITQPFEDSDELDSIIVACEHTVLFGAFIFPKPVLLEKKIITVNGNGGKRGIRVYPSWDIANNPQSKKTQKWQKSYFVSMNEGKLPNQLSIQKMLEA